MGPRLVGRLAKNVARALPRARNIFCLKPPLGPHGAYGEPMGPMGNPWGPMGPPMGPPVGGVLL